MAYTREDLEAIQRAIATGERRVRFNDREVEYRSISDLLAAKNEIEQALNTASLEKRRYYVHESGKGL